VKRGKSLFFSALLYLFSPELRPTRTEMLSNSLPLEKLKICWSHAKAKTIENLTNAAINHALNAETSIQAAGS